MQFRLPLLFEDAQLPNLPQPDAHSLNGDQAAGSKHTNLDSFLSKFRQPAAVCHSSLIWPEAAALQAHDAILRVAKAGWTSTKSCKQFVAALQRQGNLCIKYLGSNDSETADVKGSFALTLFLTCHLLQRTEVCVPSTWQ